MPKLHTFLFHTAFHFLSIALAIAGILAALAQITWLMIIGTIVAFLARPLGFFMSNVAYERSNCNPPAALQSNILALILSVIGTFLARFPLNMNLVVCFLISVNGSILLLYIAALCYIVCKALYNQLYARPLYRKKLRQLYEDDDLDF